MYNTKKYLFNYTNYHYCKWELEFKISKSLKKLTVKYIKIFSSSLRYRNFRLRFVMNLIGTKFEKKITRVWQNKYSPHFNGQITLWCANTHKKTFKKLHWPLSHWCRQGKTLVVRPLKRTLFLCVSSLSLMEKLRKCRNFYDFLKPTCFQFILCFNGYKNIL